MKDLGDERVTVSIRTVFAVILPVIVSAFIAGAGWFSLNSKVEAALIAAKPVGEIQRDVCRLKNFMINNTKPNSFDGCQ